VVIFQDSFWLVTKFHLQDAPLEVSFLFPFTFKIRM
jgi:hypothetical protein